LIAFWGRVAIDDSSKSVMKVWVANHGEHGTIVCESSSVSDDDDDSSSSESP